MARRADQENDSRRKKRHRRLRRPTEQRQRATQLSPERRKWKTGVFVVSGIFFLAGILIVIVPMATMATMVPAPALIFGVICLVVSLSLPLCFLCRTQREPSDIENTAGNLKPAAGASEKLNLSFESEQGQQLGCLQTTPKIFRFSKDRNRNHQHPQRLPLAAFKPRTAGSHGNTGESERKLAEEARKTDLAESDWRTERTEAGEAGEEQINHGFLRDSPGRGSSPISGGEIPGPVKLAPPSTFPEKTNKVPAEKKKNGNKRFSFNINKSSKNQKRKISNKEKDQNKENANVNKSFQNDFVLDSESKASYELTKEVDIDSEINAENEENQHDLNFNSSNFISKKMFESFKKNSKKNAKVENKKTGHNLPGIRNYDQFPPPGKSKSTLGPDTPFFTFTPPSPPSPTPDQQQTHDVERNAQGKQILLKSNNFSKAEEGEKKKSLNKEAKQKMWTQSSFKNKKNNKTEDSRVPPGKKPKSSSKQKEKPMKAPKQKNKDNPVIIEFENETKTEEVPSAAVLKENTGPKVSFERKGFQTKSSGGDGPTQAIPKEESSRLSDVLKVFKIEKERKEMKKPKSSCSVRNKADLLMSGESVKDKYITNNFGPRQVEEDDDASPPLVHFGNIPTDVDLIGMRMKNGKDSRKSQLSNLQQDEEEEDGKFSDILKFLSKKERTEGKVKKTKKVPLLSKKPRDQPKCRSIDEINKMLVDIADNKCPDSDSGAGAGAPDLPQLDQKLLERSLFVSFNPGGLKRHGGSMESLDDTSSVSSSVGSTGSYRSTNSTGSIAAPVRSSMKKPRNKEATGSTVSGGSAGGQSKKSVSYAIGSEQTAV